MHLKNEEIIVACDSLCVEDRFPIVYSGEERVHAHKKITFELFNRSPDKMFFAIEKDFFEQSMPIDRVEITKDAFHYANRIFYSIVDEKGIRPRKVIFWNRRPSDTIESQEAEIDIHTKMRARFSNVLRHDSFILDPGESKTMTLFTDLPIMLEADDKNEVVAYVKLNRQKKYKFALHYFSNAEVIEEYLPKSIQDSLRNHNVKIFDGALHSNSIELKVIE